MKGIHCTLQGRLGQDLELRRSGRGTKRMIFSNPSIYGKRYRNQV